MVSQALQDILVGRTAKQIGLKRRMLAIGHLLMSVNGRKPWRHQLSNKSSLRGQGIAGSLPRIGKGVIVVINVEVKKPTRSA